MMRVAVVDYGSGNIASAARALHAAAGAAGIAAEIFVTNDADELRRADRLVLPGQGAFADCAQGLAAVPGLRRALMDRVAEGAPFLGICVGMQLMAERGLEMATTPGFGWIAGEVAPMLAPGLRLPHMGWNALDFTPGAHKLLAGLTPGEHMYFVHSYALQGGRPDQIIATAEYGGAVVAIAATGNVVGTQFHVEKSQAAGLRFLANFLRWTP